MSYVDLLRGVLACLALYAGAAFIGDIVHQFLHWAARARWPILARLGGMHEAHHQFMGPDLRINRKHQTQNLLSHRVPEYLTLVLATSAGFWILPRAVVLLTMAFETTLVLIGTLRGGLDSNHQEKRPRRWSHLGLMVGPMYHGLHHMFPESYMGSVTRLFDVLFAKGCQIRGRRFAVTGASGALGAPLVRILERRGGHVTSLKFGRDYDYDDYSRLDPALAQADVLVLCHGSKVQNAMQANCDSFVAIIERYRLHQKGLRPLEVWAVGSEIEAHPAWGDRDLEIYLRSKRAFARHARRYFHDVEMLYRHIVPSAFTSPMGKGLMSGRAAATTAMFFISRGFRYIPVTYTGIAFLNWFRFVWPA
jgi:hypothetical protein